MTKPVVAQSRRAGPILICSKCVKRAPKSAGIKRELKRVLQAREHGKLKRPRLVSTSCFGICPKSAVVLASGHSLFAVLPRTCASVEEWVATHAPREALQ